MERKLKGNILIIDDEHIIRKGLEKILTFNGHVVRTAKNTHQTFQILSKFEPDIIILDLKLGEENGIKLLERIKNKYPDIYVLMLTAYGSIQTAIEAVKKGAYDYLTKPYHTEELLHLIKKILEEKYLKKIQAFQNKEKTEKYSLQNIIANSQAMKKIKEKLKIIINKNIDNILLLGESGVGKDFLAQIIHFNSPRKNHPFLAINICAISESMIESELFGYKKGAFTGADKEYPGLMELAGEGTLFFDEIGELPLSIQVKLLRTIENKEYKKLGDKKLSKIWAKFIFATNKNLEKEVKANNFRKDLYYRITPITIEIPPLRKRKEDIIPLTYQLLHQLNLEFKRNFLSISPKLEKFILQYHWPGNVRELKNFLEKLMIFSSNDDKTLDILEEKKMEKDTDEQLSDLDINLLEKSSLEEIEKKVILERLKKFNFNVTKTAKSLGIGRGALRYKIKKYNLTKKGKSLI